MIEKMVLKRAVENHEKGHENYIAHPRKNGDQKINRPTFLDMSTN
jgi:hypothetical protein